MNPVLSNMNCAQFPRSLSKSKQIYIIWILYNSTEEVATFSEKPMKNHYLCFYISIDILQTFVNLSGNMAKGNFGDIRSHDMSDTHLQHRDIILLISWTVSWQAVRHQKQDMQQTQQPMEGEEEEEEEEEAGSATSKARHATGLCWTATGKTRQKRAQFWTFLGLLINLIWKCFDMIKAHVKISGAFDPSECFTLQIISKAASRFWLKLKVEIWNCVLFGWDDVAEEIRISLDAALCRTGKAHFGQRGLQIPQTWRFWSGTLSL